VKDWEQLVDAIEIAFGFVRCGMSTNTQVLFDRELRKHAPPFHNLGDPHAHNPVRGQSVDPCAVKRDLPLGDLAAVNVQEAGKCSQKSCLARAVGAEQSHDFPFGDFQTYAAEYEYDILVDNFEVPNRQRDRDRKPP